MPPCSSANRSYLQYLACSVAAGLKFERLWIWQEILLARDAVVTCGHQSVSWLAVHNQLFRIHAGPVPLIVAENLPHKLQTPVNDIRFVHGSAGFRFHIPSQHNKVLPLLRSRRQDFCANIPHRTDGENG